VRATVSSNLDDSLRTVRGESPEFAVAQRGAASEAFFPANADRIARLCHAMAERFLTGGRLLAFGVTAQAKSDVDHVAVEFVHPVIVGKRALPAIGLCEPAQLALLAEPSDIVMVFGEPQDGAGCLPDAVSAARARGCLTIAFSELGAEWEFELSSQDPFIRQELAEVTYHVLWELVHVFFEHSGSHSEGAGAASFLYPFLDAGQPTADQEAVIADVRESVLMKADEVQDLRERTVIGSADALVAAAASLHDCFDAGGRVLALGNGGSATDAVDLVADLLAAGHPAIDLTAGSAIITAIANDIGSESIFSRQVIAYGREGDVLVALSTSGNSLSVIAALEEAKRRRMARIAFVGYDGGRVASEQRAEHLVITPSQHIPRIQEAQATAYHVLTEMVKSTNQSDRRSPQ
jgi:D-sedoheptulose 7-phosphate isomerase